MSFGVTPTGFKLKRLEDIQRETEDKFKTEFGDGINLTPQGPMGQIKGILDEGISQLWELSQDLLLSTLKSIMKLPPRMSLLRILLLL